MGSSDDESDHQRHQSKDHSDSVIDPALRTSPSPAATDKNTTGHQSRPQMSSPRRHPSPPPPITTMSSSNNSHSPSPSVVSVDRSSNSTPHIRRSPPHHAMQPPAMYSAYQHDHPIMQSNPHHSTHFVPRPEPMSHPYIYTHPPFDPRYDHRQHHHDPHRQPYPTPSAYPPAPMSHPQVPHPASTYDYGRPYAMSGQPPVTIVHTDDAATKLTDGIRRRCFNCCTTDTSTWRRSNLSPGKVLCNKCGLFERTHSRPRPDQFPHKRGPLAASTMRGRTPPGTQLPPISGAPYQYHHQPITPLNAGEYHHPHTLPGLQTWHQNNSSSSSGHTSNNGTSSGGGGPTSNGHGTNDTPQGGPGSPHRRSTHENSPRTKHQQAPRVSGARPAFDEPLSSNAAESSDRSPPASISRSSTSGGAGGAAASKVSKESTTITPPPLTSSSTSTTTGTGTASRD